MRAEWRLAFNALCARPSRAVLLVGAVGLSAALIAAVACAIGSINQALREQADSTVGGADLKITGAGTGQTVDAGLLDIVRSWPEAARVDGLVSGAVSLSFSHAVLVPGGAGFRRAEETFRSQALATAVVAGASEGASDEGARPGPLKRLVAGRWAAADDEVVVDAMLAARLGWEYANGGEAADGFRLGGFAYVPPSGGPVPESSPDAAEAARINRGIRIGPGSRVFAQRRLAPMVDIPGLDSLLTRGPAVRLTVVGIAAQPPLGGRPQCIVAARTLQRLTDQEGRLSEVLIDLREGVDVDRVAAAHQKEMPEGAILQTTARITSGLDQNIASSELGFALASILALLSASFIVTTALTTGVAERQRELAILRSIGASRAQLASSQVLVGLSLGVMGAAVGVPVGIGLAWLLPVVFPVQIPEGLTVPASGIALAGAGSVASGVVGALWPAWRVATLSPRAGIASRAAAPTARGLLLVTAGGIAAVMVQVVVVGLPTDGQRLFWGYATVGLPAMFIGWFLLGVPVTMAVGRVCSGPISRVFGLPPGMLGRTLAATPYRHGFTAGSLMTGLALMIAIWTNGGAILRDWIGKIQFPDAFVSGPALPPEAQSRLEAMPFVTGTSALSMHPVETDVFGVRAIQRYKTTFLAFEPEPFFRMSSVTWVQGDEATAVRRLEAGGAVIVAREFLIARGLGVGHRFTCSQGGRSFEFEIVGVVTSPGLEIISKFFNIGEDAADQALHAVFGSRRDLIEKFGIDTIQLIQIGLAEGADDREAVATIRRELSDFGILDAGSGRQVKEDIRAFARGMLLVFSAVAVGAMVVACLGVANLIVAGVHARRFEFGILRAVGAPAGLPARLVLAEGVVIALSAAILGSVMGIQAAWAGQRLYGLLLGLDLSLTPPWGAMAWGWGIVLGLALAASGPTAWRTGRERPLGLLGGVRG